MKNVLWILIVCALSLAVSHCNATLANHWTSGNDYNFDARRQLSKNVINCSSYIPDYWRQIMLKNEPPTDPTSGMEEFVPQQYLYACLQAELRHVNATSPFSFTARDSSFIKYNIALNEVVSLGFDGTLVTRARALLCCFSDVLYTSIKRVSSYQLHIICENCSLFEVLI